MSGNVARPQLPTETHDAALAAKIDAVGTSFAATVAIIEACSAADVDRFLLGGIGNQAKGIRLAGIKTEG
jgi:hypothetical protein